MTECLGTFNDLTNVLTDGNGDEHDWNGAVLCNFIILCVYI